MKSCKRIFSLLVGVLFICNALHAMEQNTEKRRNLWWHNGNCFMSSVIQALYYVPSFREAVLNADLNDSPWLLGMEEEYSAARELQWIFGALNGKTTPYPDQKSQDYKAYKQSLSQKTYGYGMSPKLDAFAQKAKNEYFRTLCTASDKKDFALVWSLKGSCDPLAEGEAVDNFIRNLSLIEFGVDPRVVVPLLGGVFRNIPSVDDMWHFSLWAELPFYQLVVSGSEKSLQAAIDGFFSRFPESDGKPRIKLDRAPKVLVISLEKPSNTIAWLPGQQTVTVGKQTITYKVCSTLLGSTKQFHACTLCSDVSNGKLYFLNSHNSIGPMASSEEFVGPCSQENLSNARIAGYKPCIFFLERVDEPTPSPSILPQGIENLRASLLLLKNNLEELSAKLGQLKNKKLPSGKKH